MATITQYKGYLSPSLSDTILINNAIYDLTASTVKFRMRPLSSDTLKVDSPAVIVSAASGTVRYDWAATDVDTAGEYRSWWEVTTSGKTFSTPEVILIIDDHGEGAGTNLGEIGYRAKSLLPVTWDSLSRSEIYGDRLLKSRIDTTKFRLFATVCDSIAEATIYNQLLLDYTAKVVALQIIPTGIDYWMNQHLTVQTTGTSESVSYPDRINALENLREWLVKDISDIRPELDGEFTVRKKGGFPKVTPDTPLVTPEPNDFGPAWSEGTPKNLPWGPDF